MRLWETAHMAPGDPLRSNTGEQMAHFFQSLPPNMRRRLALGTALRSLSIVVVLLVIYYLLPLDRPAAVLIVGWALAGTLALVGAIAMQIRAIRTAEYPVLRAIESIALAVPLLVVIFASTYLLLADADPDAFSEPLNHTDALYFTLVTLATIGFGDISAVSQPARVTVMVQIVANIAVLGVALKLIVGVARMSAHEAAARQ